MTEEPGEAATTDSVETAAATDDTTDAAAAVPDVRRRVVGLLAAVAAVAVVADQVTKSVLVATVENREPVRLLGGAVYFVVYRNPGAAFSMATGMTWLLTLVAIGVVLTIIRLAPRLRSVGWGVGLGLILGGAMGNIGDRLFRSPGPMRGHVVDFVSVFSARGDVFPVFNVADSCISVGGVLLVLLAVLGRDYDGTTSADRKKAAADADKGGAA